MGGLALLHAIAAFWLVAGTRGGAQAPIEPPGLVDPRHDDSAVIIEGLPEGQLTPLAPRRARQMTVGERGACLTSKGLLGKCTTFKQCYPYFKIPDLNALDGWVLGIYDTCSYTGSDGRLGFGICCSDPPAPPPTDDQAGNDASGPIVEDSDPQFDSEKNKYTGGRLPADSSWPPPLPTHPPYHTIPPLPTHPPGHGQQQGLGGRPTGPAAPTTTTSQRPLTTWPTKRPAVAAGATGPASRPPATTPPAPNEPSHGSCGSKNYEQDQNRIVGGHAARQNEWPWIAALFNAGRHICGGSVIDDRHILTAAHCVAQMTSWDVARLTVRLGDYDIKTPYETRHVEKRVKRVLRHRDFDMRTLYNDVAILTLNEPVEFSETIRPICLPSGSSLYTGKNATVIGWGSLRENGPAPGKLQEVNIPIWSNAVCKQKYGNAAPGGIVESFLCSGQANMDSCSGDSGGPLMVMDGRWTQVGIVSWGIGCGKGQYPGVYTRVTHFLPWIYKNLK